MAKFFRVINRRSGWVTYTRANNLRHAREKYVTCIMPVRLLHRELTKEELKYELKKLDKDWIVDNGKKEIKRYRSKKDKEWRYYTR